MQMRSYRYYAADGNGMNTKKNEKTINKDAQLFFII